jgi:hypothetical protein
LTTTGTIDGSHAAGSPGLGLAVIRARTMRLLDVMVGLWIFTGGLVLFDAWYGPAVLSERPAVRHKRLKGEGFEVIRLAEPVLHPNENVVDVNYQIFVKDRVSARTEEIHEQHRMRYLFVPEVELMLGQAGLRLERACEFATDGPLSCATWNVLFVATPVA